MLISKSTSYLIFILLLIFLSLIFVKNSFLAYCHVSNNQACFSHKKTPRIHCLIGLCFRLLFGKMHFPLLNPQVMNEEDDVTSDFYNDLTPLSDSAHGSTSSAHGGRRSSGIPFLFSKKTRVDATSSSSFKKAIEASYEKVVQCCLQFLPFIWFLSARFRIELSKAIFFIKALALHLKKKKNPLELHI